MKKYYCNKFVYFCSVFTTHNYCEGECFSCTMKVLPLLLLFLFIDVITVVLRCSFHEIPDSKTAESVPTEVE